MVCAPGIPNTTSTPRRTRHSTRSCPPVTRESPPSHTSRISTSGDKRITDTKFCQRSSQSRLVDDGEHRLALLPQVSCGAQCNFIGVVFQRFEYAASHLRGTH